MGGHNKISLKIHHKIIAYKPINNISQQMMLYLLTQMSKNNEPPIIIGLELKEKSTTKHATKPFTNNLHVNLNGLEI